MAQIWYCIVIFKDPQDENKIGIDGIQQFCDDLALDPASISVLIIAWKFRAATQCEFSKQEFMDGMTELGWVCNYNRKLSTLLWSWIMLQIFKCTFINYWPTNIGISRNALIC